MSGVARRPPARDRHELMVIARLRPGLTESQALPELQAVAARLAAEYPDVNRDYTFVLGAPTRFSLSSHPTKDTAFTAASAVMMAMAGNRAAGRLPQPRQHVPRARRRAPHRDRDPPVARRRPRPHPAPAPHRRVPGLARRRRRSDWSSACGRRAGWWPRSFRCSRSAASRSTSHSACGSWSRRSRTARSPPFCSRSDRRSSSSAAPCSTTSRT